MNTVIVTIVSLCLCILRLNSTLIDSVDITLPQGKIKGVRNYFGYYRKYLGIPYASVKERFQEPSDPPSWNDTLNAIYSNVKCKQFFTPINVPIGSEDCLVLNIFTPLFNQIKPLPIMVFIHGGGFYWGSNTNLIYNPKYLVQKNTIVVTVNYRLGAFGFLCLKNKEAPGNAGLKDLVAALNWIKSNIKYFGGDPYSITMFGQSAGAAAINYLILSQSTKGLFQRAILESGSVLMPIAFDDNPIKSASMVASKLGYNSSNPNDLLKIFKNSQADDIVKATHRDVSNHALESYIFRPCIEETKYSQRAIITAHPKDLLESVQLDNNIEIIIGYNDKEGIRYAARYNNDGLQKLNKNFEKIIPNNIYFTKNDDKKSFIKDVNSFYFKNATIKTHDDLIDYFSDTIIVYPSVSIIISLLKKPNISIYNYYFEYDSLRNLNKHISGLPTKVGANHGDELFYLFEPVVYQPLPNTAADFEMIQRITDMWTNFAKYGNPTPVLQIPWNKSEKNNLLFLHLDKNFKTTGLPNKDRMEFWKTVYWKYGKWENKINRQ